LLNFIEQALPVADLILFEFLQARFQKAISGETSGFLNNPIEIVQFKPHLA
jgi:hypothetical protein